MVRNPVGGTCKACSGLCLMGLASSSGAIWPRARYTPVRCLRYSASNSASLAVLCSGPNHQHQSLPSAASSDSNAKLSAVSVGASALPCLRASDARVVFPGIFAVEEKTNGERLIARHGFTEMAHATVEIGSGGFGVHAAVHETDEIGQVMIAKQSRDGFSRELHAPGFVEAIGVGGNAISVAEEPDVERAAKDAFVGSEPLETFFGGNGKRLIGDRAFGGPQTGRLRAKNSFVIFTSKVQLFARVFGTAEGAARERSARIGDARDIGIAD